VVALKRRPSRQHGIAQFKGARYFGGIASAFPTTLKFDDHNAVCTVMDSDSLQTVKQRGIPGARGAFKNTLSWLSDAVMRPGGPTVIFPRFKVPRVPVKITCKPLTGSSMEFRKQNGPRLGMGHTTVVHRSPVPMQCLHFDVRGQRSCQNAT